MSDLLKYKGFEGTAEVDIDRGVCRGKLLFIDDLVTYEAPDVRSLHSEFQAAVDDYLQTCAELGREPKRPFSGLFNVRVPSQLHRAAAVRAAALRVSLNTVVVTALEQHLAASEPARVATQAATSTAVTWLSMEIADRRGSAITPEPYVTLFEEFQPLAAH